MSSVARIHRQLVSLGTLSEAVTAMSSLSAHHLRQARRAMPTARTYETELGRALSAAGVQFPEVPTDGPTLLVVVGSQLGLCGGYNGRVADAAARRRDVLGQGPTVAAGRRIVGALGRRGVDVDEPLEGITSLSGVSGLALLLAERALTARRQEGVGAVELVVARFQGVGTDTPEVVPVLPLRLPPREGPVLPVRYTTAEHLAEESARELLYVGMVAALTEALVCEHAARLLATRSAGDWLEDRVHRLRRKEASARQESSTQETLEVVSASRALPNEHPS